MKGLYLTNVLSFVLDSVAYPKISLTTLDTVWSELSSRTFWSTQFSCFNVNIFIQGIIYSAFLLLLFLAHQNVNPLFSISLFLFTKENT